MPRENAAARRARRDREKDKKKAKDKKAKGKEARAAASVSGRCVRSFGGTACNGLEGAATQIKTAAWLSAPLLLTLLPSNLHPADRVLAPNQATLAVCLFTCTGHLSASFSIQLIQKSDSDSFFFEPKNTLKNGGLDRFN